MIRSVYAPWPEGARRPWGWAALALAALSYLASALPVLIITMVYAAVQTATGADVGEINAAFMGEDALSVMFPALLAQFAVWLVLTFIWLGAFERRGASSIGFCGRGFLARYLRGLVIGVALVAALSGLAVLLAPGGADAQDAAARLESIDPSLLLTGAVLGALGFILVGFLFQGAVEEVIFRGWLLSALASRWGVALAAFASCGLFSLLHLHVFASGAVIGSAAIAGITMTGLFFAAYAIAERSLAGVMGAHGAYNASLVIASMAPQLASDPEASSSVVFGEVLQQATALSAPDEFVAGPQLWAQTGLFGFLALMLALRLVVRRKG